MIDFSPIDFRNYQGFAPSISHIPLTWEGCVPKAREHKNAVATAVTILLESHSGEDFSIDYFIGNKTYSIGAITLLECFKIAHKFGAVKLSDFPFSPKDDETAVELVEEFEDSLIQKSYKVNQYVYLEDFNSIKKLIELTNKPVVAMIEWYSDTEIRKGTIRSRKKGTYDIKPLLIYGWTERGWKVLNPNDPSWGENGCAILPFHVPIYECWGIVPPELVEKKCFIVKKPYSSKVGNFFAKVLNSLGLILGF